VNTAVDNVNVIMGDVRAQNGPVGKLLYIPSLYDEAKKSGEAWQCESAIVRAGKGTLGSGDHDSFINKGAGARHECGKLPPPN